jgi:DNA-binding NarL/FixJ family response regulator
MPPPLDFLDIAMKSASTASRTDFEDQANAAVSDAIGLPLGFPSLVPARPQFTARQVEVLRLVCEGLRPAAIGRKLGYSESTIKKELQDFMHEVGARNRTQAVAIAIRANVV